MFRTALPAFRAIARSTAAPAVARPAFVAQRIAGQRFYAASAGLDKEQITSRVLDVLKGFEKVDGGKVSGWLVGVDGRGEARRGFGSAWRERE